MTKAVAHSLTSVELPLEGQKVILRAFEERDITSHYLGWLNNPQVVRYSNQRFRQHTRKSSQEYLATFDGSSNQFLAICDRGTSALVGTLTIYRNFHHGTADIGIMVGDPATWGKGFGLDAFRAVVEALERSGNVRKITAGSLAINVGMIRIMERAGMKWEATRRAQELVDGEPVDVVYFARFCNV